MATDWPSHGAFNRHLSLPPSCGARLWFTEYNEPPFSYRLVATDPLNPIWWFWTQFTHYVGIMPDELLARWQRAGPDPVEVELWTLSLNTQGNPHTHHVTLRADHFNAVQVSSAENVIDLGEPEGWRMPRGTVLTFPASNWVELTNFPLDQGIPNVTITATPIDCIPNWRPGDPLP